MVQDSNGIKVEVKDEGRGFSVSTPTPLKGNMATLGVGITGMQERVRQLHGQLEIRSDVQGTTVKAWIPLGRGQDEPSLIV